MALWGNKDTKSVTGTITTVQNDTAIVGAGTAFTTELKVGQTLVIDTVPYTIASIQSDTALELQVAYAAVGAALLVVTANESPAYVAHALLTALFTLAGFKLRLEQAVGQVVLHMKRLWPLVRSRPMQKM
jgi:hypothetical protein